MIGAPVTLTLKLGRPPLRVKGFLFRGGEGLPVAADLAGKILAGHGEDFEAPKGEPIPPPDDRTKAEALQLLRRPDHQAALSEVKALPEAVQRTLRASDPKEEDVLEAARKGGPWMCALFCALMGKADRAKLCLLAEG